MVISIVPNYITFHFPHIPSKLYSWSIKLNNIYIIDFSFHLVHCHFRNLTYQFRIGQCHFFQSSPVVKRGKPALECPILCWYSNFYIVLTQAKLKCNYIMWFRSYFTGTLIFSIRNCSFLIKKGFLGLRKWK